MLLQLVRRDFAPNFLDRRMLGLQREVEGPDVRFELTSAAVVVMLFL
jgi:hypothetical protein